MTISPDARTPSASVHALSGSTPPGAGATMQPFGVATAAAANLGDTFVPLGGAALDAVAVLAVRRARAQPDAEIIDLAGRVKRLAARENRVVLHTCRIEDAVFDAMRSDPRPDLSEPKLRFSSQRSTEADGTCVTVIREPAGWKEESRALREAHDAALAARKRREEQEGVRRDLPYWMKLRERAGNRLYRWILQLAEKRPTTQAGLAAKAAAVEAIAEDGGEKLPCDWHQRLATSLASDVVRLAVASAAAESADPFAGYHAEIMGLQRTIAATEEDTPEHEAVWTRWKEIDALALASRPTTLAGAVGALDYARRELHQFNVEGTQNAGGAVDITERLALHLIDGALGVFRPLVDRSASFGASPAPDAQEPATVEKIAAMDFKPWPDRFPEADFKRLVAEHFPTVSLGWSVCTQTKSRVVSGMEAAMADGEGEIFGRLKADLDTSADFLRSMLDAVTSASARIWVAAATIATDPKHAGLTSDPFCFDRAERGGSAPLPAASAA